MHYAVFETNYGGTRLLQRLVILPTMAACIEH